MFFEPIDRPRDRERTAELRRRGDQLCEERQGWLDRKARAEARGDQETLDALKAEDAQLTRREERHERAVGAECFFTLVYGIAMLALAVWVAATSFKD